MINLAKKCADFIRNILKTFYYLPYNIQIVKRKMVKEMLISDTEEIHKLQNGSRRYIGVASSKKRIDDIQNRIKLLEIKKTISEWMTINEIGYKEMSDNYYIFFELYDYPAMANEMRKKGHQEGIDFILLFDYNKYRNTYKETMKQRKWIEVEGVREISKSTWINRIILMRNMIGDYNKNVLDIGCWEGELEEFLPSNIKYYGCDYVKRKEETLVCDLNKFEFPKIQFDVAYISGSLEYMENLEWYFCQICKARNEIVLSYSLLEYYPLIEKRKLKSWINHLTLIEIMSFMEQYNFKLEKSDFWGRWTIILKFVRKKNVI